MLDSLLQLFGSSSAVTNTSEVLINLAFGVAMSVTLSWHYVRFGKTYANRRELAQVFALVVLSTVLIISLVQSDVALSLGLVGALSIVRFRTPIKEPEELAYLFAGDPVLINRYDREYYVTADGAVRATLDYGLATFDQRGTTQPNLHTGRVRPDVLVVELKAPADQSERLAEAVAGVPLRVTRHSKYAVGVAAMLKA